VFEALLDLATATIGLALGFEFLGFP